MNEGFGKGGQSKELNYVLWHKNLWMDCNILPTCWPLISLYLEKDYKKRSAAPQIMPSASVMENFEQMQAHAGTC